MPWAVRSRSPTRSLPMGPIICSRSRATSPRSKPRLGDYFRTVPKNDVVTKTTVEKSHGRIETRCYTASQKVDWILADKSYPGQPCFSNIKTLLMVQDRTE